MGEAPQNQGGEFWMIQQNWERAPPKYVRNPYIYYCQTNFGRFARVLNSRMPQCIVRAMGQAWRNLEAWEKKPYVEMFETDIERYKTTKAKWAAAYRGRPPRYRKRNKYAMTWLPYPAPKRYRTAFIWYHAAIRTKVQQEEFPTWDGAEVVQEIAKRWRDLSEEEKAPYKQQADEDMTRYLNEMRDYRRAIFRQEANTRVRNLQIRLSVMRQRSAQLRAAKNQPPPDF